MSIQLFQGNCREILRSLADNSIDACVTDPPYELGFMGKAWDASGVAYDVGVWREVLRVLKPGAYLLAFGGSRTYHRLACAIEDAGFEIRDQIMWLYGSGFPKSHNGPWGGTALKPAHEPIVVARKPLIGTVAENVSTHGTGGLNIDGCRIGTSKNVPASVSRKASPVNCYGQFAEFGEVRGVGGHDPNLGRWPANVIHDGSEEVLAAFPDAPGQQAAESFTAPSGKSSNVYRPRGRRPGGFGNVGAAKGDAVPNGPQYVDRGSAARFFYCAKASKKDRNDGCVELPDVPGGMVSNTSGQHITRRDGGAPGTTKNNHPTVKPTDLMRYLCRLVTPPGGTVLDPFLGSGSTGRGAALEGFSFVGVELSAEYLAIAQARIRAITLDEVEVW